MGVGRWHFGGTKIGLRLSEKSLTVLTGQGCGRLYDWVMCYVAFRLHLSYWYIRESKTKKWVGGGEEVSKDLSHIEEGRVYL